MMVNYLLVLLIGWLHPLHLSVSDLVLNAGTGNLEISHRIFLDDLEDALRAHTGEPIDLSNPKDPEKVQQAVGRYLQQHFRLSLNGKAVQPQYLGYELEQEAIWAYMEVPRVRQISTITIQNTLFFDRFTDQLNLVHVTQKGKIQSLRLDHKQPEGSMRF
ncbi:DUF6702 family protein [Cesiribacter andamanensis]|uniref:Uncharacterized protein n=1 Tax=Cesiribacter andamanensis AMV16 TaxID=1279009 RepID=M7NLE4_9BACT|nr:DUF6702 family protein [Cesiribacter andamanensis]EMR02610.1 hypothetical protein ADICEAN_02266 [Cesiribacter andamanensis AMV16]